MIKSIAKLLLTFVAFVAVFMLQRVVFVAVYHNLLPPMGIGEWWGLVSHGLEMDCSVAGYLTALPGLLYVVEAAAGQKRWIKRSLQCIVAVEAVLIATIFVADIALYGYWGFRLDMMPVFYFSTAPASALASSTAWQLIGGIASICIIATLIWIYFNRFILSLTPAEDQRIFSAGILLILCASLIIPIRGGTGIAPMSLGRAYFSDSQRLNHAAINPAFSLLYSATHQNKGLEEFCFFKSEEAQHIWAEYEASLIANADTSAHFNKPILRCSHPDVYLVILESFSAHLMPSLGGEPIAINLDSLAREGISFTNFYANSFRTDRALPCILSAFPSLPTMSLLKHVEKIERLPSVAKAMQTAGYTTCYYYGGDLNFANMQAYLTNCGFDRIVSDRDFSSNERKSKWGAHDHVVFNRALADADTALSTQPHFSVIQTSSSHEPFEVPYNNPEFADYPQKNAFAYTDSCLMAFVDHLKQSPRWHRSLVVFVPDHLGAWPLDLPIPRDRHHIPLVMVGGALNSGHLVIDVPGSQTDIAATLLSLLNTDATAFPFSRNMFDSNQAHYGVFSETELFGLVDCSGSVTYIIESGKFTPTMPIPVSAHAAAKAYLQLSYEAMAML